MGGQGEIKPYSIIEQGGRKFIVISVKRGINDRLIIECEEVVAFMRRREHGANQLGKLFQLVEDVDKEQP